jgi:peptidyl-prolyl cis-trans isomerase SurA
MKNAMKKGIISIVFNLFVLSAATQTADKVVMKVGNEEVMLSEFEYIFKKNNTNKTITKEALDEYLELFTIFKLKVKEAKELKMDTAKSFISELNGYVKQLAVPYLKDREAENNMVKETYDRLQKDLKIRHILIRTKECDAPKDTLAAWNKIQAIRKEIASKKITFEEAAKKYSQDSISAPKGGLLGYYTALSLVYPFENEAYRLKVGELSNVVRTNYGYHLIQVDDIRPARGKIKVAHIFIRADKDNKAQIELSSKRIQEAYEKLNAGEPFESVVKTYSDDFNSSSKGGELPPFGINQMVDEFEEAAFALQTPGEYSKPFQTRYGFHIVKLIEKIKLPPFEEYKTELTKILQKQKRWEVTKQSMIEKLKKEYGFVENKSWIQKLDTEASKNGEKITREYLLGLPDEKLFELKGRIYKTKDFVNYVANKIASDKPVDYCPIRKTYYPQYIGEQILAYKEENLPNEFPEFKMLVNEYRDGILLFNLMDQMVWGKSMKDTTGLKEFYEKNKNNYMWGERASVIIVDVKDDKVEAEARKLAPNLLNGKMTKEQFAAKLNKKVKDNVILLDGLYTKEEKEKNSLLAGMNWSPGIGATEKKDNKIRFAIITSIIPPQPKTLKEAKGMVISDYQNYLEQQWIKELKSKYKVEVNKNVLYSLISK